MSNKEPELIKNTVNTPVKLGFYYILDFRELKEPKILNAMYPNKAFAKKAIRKKYSGKDQRFLEVVSGKKLKGLFLIYSLGLKSGKFKKYDYPKHCNTTKLRWNYRRQVRVRLRRMGLYFPTTTHKVVTHTTKSRTRIIPKTKQLKTNTHNTASKAIKLARKPKHFLYILKEKNKLKRKGWLISLSVVKVNLKTGDFQNKKIHITSKDFIQPYLISEAFEMIHQIKNNNGQRFLDTYREEDFKPYAEKQRQEKEISD